jgi:hypothetical protein
MAKWRKKPIVVEAEVYQSGMEDGYQVYFTEMPGEGSTFLTREQYEAEKNYWTILAPAIKTLEGWHIITPGDFIITGIEGERYPCKPAIFMATYEPVIEKTRV